MQECDVFLSGQADDLAHRAAGDNFLQVLGEAFRPER